MRRRAQRWDVAVFGEVGYDAYLLDDSTCVVRPAGSAFNIGYGLLSARASGALVASVPERFDRRQLDPLNRGDVEVFEQAVDPRLDQLYLFDMRNGATDAPSFLGTAPIQQGADLLAGHKLGIGIVHIGTMDSNKVIRITERVRDLGVSSSSIFSMNLRLRCFNENPNASLLVLRLCDLVFLDAGEFEPLCRQIGGKELCSGRTLVVSSGASGATLIVDGVAAFHYIPTAMQPVCTVGATDVLVGSFLGAYSLTENPSLALAYACEAAVRSMTDYGVGRSLDVFTSFRSVEDALPLIHGASLGFASISDSRVEMSLLPKGFDIIEATGLFVIEDGSLLLIDKVAGRELQRGVKYVPGGKLEPGETPEQCARRELQEETALGVAAIELVSIFTYLDAPRQRAYKFYQFVVKPTAGTAVPGDDVAGVHWTRFEELKREKVFDLSWAQIVLLRMGRRLG